MTALAANRRIREERWTYKQFAMAAVHAFQGGQAAIDLSTGYVMPAAANTKHRVIGTFAEEIDNSGGAAGGAVINVKLDREVAITWFVNGSSGDAIASSDVGKVAYALDDQTVSILAKGNARAGLIWGVDSTLGVAVELEHGASVEPSRPLAGATLAFTAGDCAIASPVHGALYLVPTTAANSTISLGNTGSKFGDTVTFLADGTANGHTVQYRDGSTAISAAATASKRHLATLVFNGTVWAAQLTVGP